jgi:hypothetical protein
MTTKIACGLTYEVISPSFWQLKGYPVDISFLGDTWLLSLPGKDEEPIYSYFHSREEACAMISQAFISKRVIQ